MELNAKVGIERNSWQPERLLLNEVGGKMRKHTIHLIILFMTILGVAIAIFLIKESQKKSRQSKKQELRLVLPRFDFLLSKDIDERLAKANLQSLRSVLMPDGDFEVRVWMGFGLNGEDGFILRYFSRQWSAIHLQDRK